MIDKRLSIEIKAIYVYMASYAGAEDTAFPGVELMIEHLRISEKRFYKYRKELVDQDYVSITKTRKENNIYTLNQIIKSQHSQFECVQSVATNNSSIKKQHNKKIEKVMCVLDKKLFLIRLERY
ncbi:hypothetical protein Curi_c13530 [Gottschalkia acidurici 9a]|uniref:Helix-turn-helix domain-containing protein n=1 Tax=Gottschalkia acidurici (strain ATCC 7906 / DSM 604 / BCRC 14475 / CIP 104303 / KCTC 5404 / NCIMB 10678 / 9a) TaxID=1128398 RepID=K0AX31_GOTA9|nr:helix-turn-helix domain-containing protein [Gottschalkia acidurici]AFS78363.1 hypothetical protein Curi_c13530 [Gottschalkia acidurici 9a]